MYIVFDLLLRSCSQTASGQKADGIGGGSGGGSSGEGESQERARRKEGSDQGEVEETYARERASSAEGEGTCWGSLPLHRASPIYDKLPSTTSKASLLQVVF